MHDINIVYIVHHKLKSFIKNKFICEIALWYRSFINFNIY